MIYMIVIDVKKSKDIQKDFNVVWISNLSNILMIETDQTEEKILEYEGILRCELDRVGKLCIDKEYKELFIGNRNIMHFSHEEDLDGHGCFVVSQFIAELNPDKYEGVMKGYLTPSNANEKLRDFFSQPYAREYPLIIISDIGSINPETSEIIDHFRKLNPGINIIVVDHHPESEYLNKYQWGFSCENIYLKDGKIEKHSATKLLFNLFFKEEDPFDSSTEFMVRQLKTFVDNVSEYDTWTWVESGKTHAADLNTLFFAIKDKFVDDIVDKIKYMGGF